MAKKVDYELIREIRLKHNNAVDLMANRLSLVLPAISIRTYSSSHEPTHVRVAIPLDLKLPLELDDIYFASEIVAKVRPQIEAIGPNNKEKGIYSIIVQTFSDFKPNPWPLKKRWFLDSELEGVIYFDDPLLKYPLNSIRRWNDKRRLPEDIVEFMKHNRRITGKGL